jgi:type IV pilus assembly protein PilV
MIRSTQHDPRQCQQGVGLVEVLVALLLLAIGVVGFAGLQVRAISATSEAFQRSQAMVLARDVSERIRVNNSDAARAIYANNSKWTGVMSSANCLSIFCSAVQLAEYDITQVRLLAKTIGPNGQVQMQDCPSNLARHCLYVSWNDTAPKNATSTDDTACTLNGSFQPNSNCVMLETY